MFICLKSPLELENLIEKSKSLVLDFYADWCGPCKKLGQYIESVKDTDEFKDIVFCKLNVDMEEFQDICHKYKVNGIPHVVFFKDSKQIKTITGYSEKDILLALQSIS
jgi:thioredoxin 1